MKHKIFYIMLLVLCILCTACAANRPLTYELEEKSQVFVIEDTEFSIPYVQITKCTDKKLQKKVNDFLITIVPDIVAKDQRKWIGFNDYSIEITNQTSEYLSLLYDLDLDDGGYFNKFGNGRIGITIDMKTGERVFLDHFFESAEQLYEAMKKSEPEESEFFVPVWMEDANKVFSAASLSELEYLKQKAEEYPKIYHNLIGTLGHKPTFYLTPTEIVVVRDTYDWNDVLISYDLVPIAAD